MSLDPNDARPPYQQIADEFRKAIHVGEYQPGEQLPSLNELAERYDVAKGTIQAAMRALRDSGLVVARQGKGVFVRTDASTQETPPDINTVMRQLDDLSTGMQQLADRVAELEQSVQGRPTRR